MQKLFPSEERIFAEIGAHCHGRPILDIGVGGGRTTPHLMALSPDYLGIDYSLEMIDACRSRFPAARLAVGDARDLRPFTERPFFLIVFSFNGIDYVTHSERERILAEIFGCLEEGGFFVFSTHNIRYDRRRSQRPPRRWAGRLKDRIRSLRYLRSTGLRAGPAGTGYRVEPEFNGNKLLTYYISAEQQVAQLLKFGFDCESIYDTNGDVITDYANSDSPWLYYVARKASAKSGA